ncbi:MULTISPECIES: lactococcin 972 family bacteriocin [Curtobacterium]|uniref:Lactococcin 972 family bacteriocin n=1 Tax=Curtobacterium citreum TaxID=2036 RepID=A0ABU8YCX4_9MICO
MQNSKAKALIGIGLAVGLIAGPATVASASALEVLGSGAETGGVTIIDPGAGVSGETRDYSTHGDGGGGSFWQWGVGRDDTWSNYFREKRCHGATAVGKKSKRVSNVPGGKYAMAMTPKASSGNKAYYHNC